jgi:hypothetical protein
VATLSRFLPSPPLAAYIEDFSIFEGEGVGIVGAGLAPARAPQAGLAPAPARGARAPQAGASPARARARGARAPQVGVSPAPAPAPQAGASPAPTIPTELPPTRERCLPDGRVAMVINLGHDTLLTSTSGQGEQLQSFYGGVLHGAFSQASVIDTASLITTISVCFKPGGGGEQVIQD